MNNYLPTDYQNFIALSRYARWNDEEQRRITQKEEHINKKHMRTTCSKAKICGLYAGFNRFYNIFLYVFP